MSCSSKLVMVSANDVLCTGRAEVASARQAKIEREVRLERRRESSAPSRSLVVDESDASSTAILAPGLGNEALRSCGFVWARSLLPGLVMNSRSSSAARSQVVVVGAGPVGLIAALRLRRQGVDVRVFDQQSESRAYSFPVVLHPQTVRILTEAEVSAPIFWRGKSIERLAVFAGGERRAVLQFPTTAAKIGLLTLPQNVLRQALLHELSRLGVDVEWNARLLWLEQDERCVWGRLSHEAPLPPSGYSRVDTVAFEADYVIGADGYESTVRDAAGLRLVSHGAVQTFGFFDVTTPSAGTEALLALTDEYVSSVYPLQGGRSRFSFQIGPGLGRSPDASAFEELRRARLPWFTEEISAWEWGGVAEFRHALVDRYGTGRIWLAGEAAHLTGPLGVQSLNVGMDEAHELASRIAGALRRSSSAAFGPHYDERRRWQWQKLLGIVPYAPVTSSGWPQSRAAELLASLPASGDDLDDLVDQLSLAGRGPSERARAIR